MRDMKIGGKLGGSILKKEGVVVVGANYMRKNVDNMHIFPTPTLGKNRLKWPCLKGIIRDGKSFAFIINSLQLVPIHI